VFVRVGEKDLDLEGGVLRQEKGKTRDDVKPRKRDRRADAQTPRQGRVRTARGEFGFVGLAHRLSPRLDDGHAAAEPTISLRQLEAHIPGPEHWSAASLRRICTITRRPAPS